MFSIYTNSEKVNRSKKVSRIYRYMNFLSALGFFKACEKRTTFLTLHQKGFKSSRELEVSWHRVLMHLKRKYGLKWWILASEYQKRGSLHYHIILFDVPFIPLNEIVSRWCEGGYWIEQAKGVNAITYLIKYVKEGLRISFSPSFEKYSLLPIYPVKSLAFYDTKLKKVYLQKPSLKALYFARNQRGEIIGQVFASDMNKLRIESEMQSEICKWFGRM